MLDSLENKLLKVAHLPFVRIVIDIDIDVFAANTPYIFLKV